jgi:type I restriction enzyme S subunit
MRETLVKSEEFKHSPLGKIPEDWDVVTVESIAADKPYAVVDGPFGSNLKTEHYREYGIPVIQSGFVTSGVFLAESYVYVDRTLFQAQKRSAVEPGDIVMAKIGAQCGTSAILPANHPVGILAGNSLKISTNPDKCRAAYLLRILHYYYDTGQIDLIKTETAQPAISLKNLRALKIPLPLWVKEQDAITSILDALDETIAHTSSLIAKLKQMKAGLLHDLLTRGLDENGELRDAIGHPEQFKDSPLGQIPKDWEVYPLKECVCRDAQITYGIVQAGSHVEGGVPYIRTGDMAGDRLSIKGLLRTSPQIAASYHRSKVRTGEIVCAIRATVGKVLEVPPELDGANLTQGTARIAPREDINNHFLLWALRSTYVQRQFGLAVKGTTFSEITLENLRQIKVALPSHREEQDKIAEILDSHDTRTRAEEVYRDKLKLQKQGLMHDLLTGKVRVKDADKLTSASDTV